MVDWRCALPSPQEGEVMSRAGYCGDDIGMWDLIRWRGAVQSALNGKRGQAFLEEMLVALDALPEKKLISHDLIHDGEVCAIGAVGLLRGTDMSKLNPEFSSAIADCFGIADAMVREIEFINDEDYFPGYGKRLDPDEDPEARFIRVRKWVKKWIIKDEAVQSGQSA